MRNQNTHQHYISKQEFQKIEQVEGQLHDLQFNNTYLDEFTESYLDELNLVITDELKWFDYTEKEFTDFLEKFFDRLASKMTLNGELIIPKFLPENLSFSPKIHRNFRRRFKHNKVFELQDD